MADPHWPLGVSTGCCRDVPIAQVWEAIAAAGIARIELGTPPEHFSPADNRQAWRVALQLIQQPFVPISVHAPFGAALDLGSGLRPIREAGIQASLAAARALLGHPGAIVVAHPSDLRRDQVDPREVLRRALDSLLVIDSFCRDAGLRLAVETPLPHLVGGHPGEMRWLLEQMPSTVGMCLDTGHAHLGRFIRAFIDLAGPRLMHVHLHDNRGTADEHLIPGRGTIDWCEVFEALRGAGYAGALMLELSCPRPSAAYFTEAVEAARHLCLAHAPAMLPPHPTGAES